MGKPQISLIDLQWCIVLIAIGVCAPIVAHYSAGSQAALFVFLLAGSPVLVGAGLGMLFKQPVIGAILGPVLIWGPLFLFVLYLFG